MSDVTDRLEVSVEDQTFRFTPRDVVPQGVALSLTGASQVGDEVVLERSDPRATLVFEQTGGILVHGIARPEVAKLVAREALLRLGYQEEGLTMESGPILLGFRTGRSIISSVAISRLNEASMNKELGAIEIAATRFGGTIILFPSGRGFVFGMNSRKIAELAIHTYLEILGEEGALA
ncbi:MAG: hypothetical protein ACJZ4X_05770 [Candidatus Thalassarchaeaceae archaeon]|tara:strand:+ start:238 stop:771 length:534 start_codon:yes stop_codon:yes gene_type:complete